MFIVSTESIDLVLSLTLFALLILPLASIPVFQGCADTHGSRDLSQEIPWSITL